MSEMEERTRKARKEGAEFTESKPEGFSFREFRVSVSANSAFFYFGLLAITAVWLAAIYAAPVLVAGGRVFAGAMVYGAFAAVCHQRPERSFHYHGLPLAVCARCLGIYAGFALGLVGYPFVRRLDDERLPQTRWLLLAVAPTVIDFGLGVSGLIENTHLSRLLTGALAGSAVAFYLVPGLVSTFTTWILKSSAGEPAFPADYSRRTPDHE